MSRMLPVRSLCRNRGAWIILAIAMIVVSLAAGATVLQGGSPKEQPGPHALVQVNREVPTILEPPVRTSREDFADYLKTQIALLQSNLVLNTALHSPAVAKLPAVAALRDPVTWLGQRLEINTIKDTGILRVSVKGGPADEQALLANAVVGAYMQEVVLQEQRKRQSRLKKLKDYYADYDTKLHDKRETLRRMQKQLGGVSDPGSSLNRQFALKQVQAVEKDVLEAQAQIRRAKMEIVLAEAMAQGKPADMPMSPAAIDEALRKDPAAARLLDEIGRLERQITDFTDRTPNPEAEPTYKKAARRLDSARKEVAARREAIVGELRQQQWNALKPNQHAAEQRVEQLRKVEEMLHAERKTRLKAIKQFNEEAVDLQWLRDEIRQLEEVTKQISRQMQTLELEMQAPSRILVLQDAAVPGK